MIGKFALLGLISIPNAGFYFIPGALTAEDQCRWIRESLTSFPQPPNRTNHNAIYGPIEDLFASAKEGQVLVLEGTLSENVTSDNTVIQSDVSSPRWKFVEELGEFNGKDECKSVPASVLLRKLRWSTLGLQFDWSKVLLNPIFSSSIDGYKLSYISVSILFLMNGSCLPMHVMLDRNLMMIFYYGK